MKAAKTLTYNYSNVEDTNNYDLIPDGTFAKVRLTIKADLAKEQDSPWEDEYISVNPNTKSAYLKCEYVIVEGPYVNRKVWDLIGIHSEKGPKWNEMGEIMIANIINSAHSLDPADKSPATDAKRSIKSFRELDNLTFVAEIAIVEGKDKDGNPTINNKIKRIITPSHTRYAEVFGKKPAAFPSASLGAPKNDFIDDGIPF